MLFRSLATHMMFLVGVEEMRDRIGQVMVRVEGTISDVQCGATQVGPILDLTSSEARLLGRPVDLAIAPHARLQPKRGCSGGPPEWGIAQITRYRTSTKRGAGGGGGRYLQLVALPRRALIWSQRPLDIGLRLLDRPLPNLVR